jgi:cell division protein FtsB
LAPVGPSLNVRALIFIIAIIALVLMLAAPFRNLMAQREEISRLQAQSELANQQVEVLENAKSRWNDPQFVAAQARARLHYVLPGEIAFTVIGLDGEPADVDNQQSPTAWLERQSEANTWYKKLFLSWQAADQGIEDISELIQPEPFRANAPR